MSDYVYLTFTNTTDAIAFEKTARKEDLPGRIIPTPTFIRATCGLTFRMAASDYELHKERIRQIKIPMQRQ